MKSKKALFNIFGTVLLITALNCSSDTGSDNTPDGETIDITEVIFTERSSDCSNYTEEYASFVKDIQNNTSFEGSVTIEVGSSDCTISVNGIPNHNFNDETARFATDVAEVGRLFTVERDIIVANQSTDLSQLYWDAIMLNGVVLDLVSAGCYKPNDPSADQDGNVSFGCTHQDEWLIDPLGTESKFGADIHNAHTQPDGTYHYHGNPNAMFDDEPGENGSPVIGFAADGFPIYGSYFLDPQTNQVRKAVSGYGLKPGTRSGPDDDNPGGEYDGTYRNDFIFTGEGDLDACNGMTVNGQYGYYVTDSFPWVMGCYSGTVHSSFNKGGGPSKSKVADMSWQHAH